MKRTYIIAFILVVFSTFSCNDDFLTLEPKGTALETNFYRTEEELYQGLVSVYDVLQWGGRNGWTMQLGLMNAASDDCLAGGSDASDQPSWVAMDNFTLTPSLGPQAGLWSKYYTGIARANLVLEKLAGASSDIKESFINRATAEVKFLRAYYYFELVRLFGNPVLTLERINPDGINAQKQVTSAEVYAQIETDLRDAYNTFDLPATVPLSETGRVTLGAVTSLLGKVILYQNDPARMAEAATLFEEVISSGIYALETDYGKIFDPNNEWGVESIFEINHSENQRGGYGNFGNGETEGNYNIQFFGMRDFIPSGTAGSIFGAGWGFCPVSESLVEFMKNDPRFAHTIIDGKALIASGASYSAGYQNTDYFIRKYCPIESLRAGDGEPALNWRMNEKVIRYADVLLMCAEAHALSGNDARARTLTNRVRSRVGLQPLNSSGAALVDAIYRERRMELATEGHRFFDLVRSGRAVEFLGPLGFTANKNEVLPLPQVEIDISNGVIKQNNNY
jgi:hypothetical protein